MEGLADKVTPGEKDSLSVASTEDDASRKRLVRRMRIQIWAGALVGLFIAFCIGAAFSESLLASCISAALILLSLSNSCRREFAELARIHFGLTHTSSRPPAQFFTTLNDLWSRSEEIWEGSFSLLAW